MMIGTQATTATKSTGLTSLVTQVTQNAQQESRTSKLNEKLGKAFDVYISQQGKDFDERKRRDDELQGLTPAEQALRSLQNTLDEKRDQKEQVTVLEQQLESDTSLTEEDKDVLQKQIDRLKQDSMTDDDWLSEWYSKKNEIEGELARGEVDGDYADSLISYYDTQIAETQSRIKEKNIEHGHLLAQANQERSDRYVEEAQATEQEDKAAPLDSEAMLGDDGTTSALLESLLSGEADRLSAGEKHRKGQENQL